jgi:hypothetical protein
MRILPTSLPRTRCFAAWLIATLVISLPACSKDKPAAAPTTPAPAPAAAPAPQGIAVGEPNPAAPAGGDVPAPGPRPASVTDQDVALADKMVSLMEKLSTNVVDAGTDCAKVAAAIKSIGVELSSVMNEGKKMEERLKGDEAAKKWFEGTYAPKVMGPMTKLMGSPCANDKGVQEAMAALKM